MNKLYFDHVPKCAGLAVRAYLSGLYGVDEICPEGGFMPYAQTLNRYSKFAVVACHVWYAPGDQLSRDRFNATLLRDPVNRSLSHILFAKADIGGQAHGFSNECKSRTLEEIVTDPTPVGLEYIGNLMTKHFSQLLWDGSSTLSNDQRLSLATSALEAFDLVGIQEELDDFAIVLGARLGQVAAGDVPRINVTSTKHGQDVSPNLRKRLLELNQLDLELWHHAQKLFSYQRRQCIVTLSRGARAEPRGRNNKNFSPSQPDSTLYENRYAVEFGTHEAEILGVFVRSDLGPSTDLTLAGDMIYIQVLFRANTPLDDVTVGISLRDFEGRLVFGTNTYLLGKHFDVVPGINYKAIFPIHNCIGIGRYEIGASIHRGSSHLDACYHWKDRAGSFQVVGNIGEHFEGMIKLASRFNLVEVTDELDELPIAISESNRLPQHIGYLNLPIDACVDYVIDATINKLSFVSRETIAIPVRIENRSEWLLPATGSQSVAISYHWLTEDEQMYDFEGIRTPLNCDLPPFGSVTQFVSVVVPEQLGVFKIQFVLIQEDVRWFDECKKSSLIEVVVKPR